MGSLANIGSALNPLLSAAGVPGVVLGVGQTIASQRAAHDYLQAQQTTALRQLQEQQGLAEASAEQDASMQKAQIAADATAAEERRKTALRRAVARQKTLFSAQGLGADTGGSNEAVLLGLYNESDGDAKAQAKSDALKAAALDQNINQLKQKNLLQAAQFAQNQKLARALQDY